MRAILLLLIIASFCFGADATAPSLSGLYISMSLETPQTYTFRGGVVVKTTPGQKPRVFIDGQEVLAPGEDIPIGYQCKAPDGVNTRTYLGSGSWEETTLYV